MVGIARRQATHPRVAVLRVGRPQATLCLGLVDLAVRPSGSCSRARLDYGCRGGTDIYVTPDRPGSCRLEVDLVDRWGLTGTTTLAFDVP